MNKKTNEVRTIAVTIMTDSTCDLSKEDQARLGITVIPLTVHFADESFRDGVDITNAAFYRKLEQAEKLPTTSMIPPDQFVKAFRLCVDRGEQVVGLFISSDISGTYHAACLAKESFADDEVHVIDSRSASLSLALLVAEAAKCRDEGCTGAEIVARMKPLIEKVRFFAVVNTLKYLRRGGRISAASAVVGEMIGIKPIVAIVDGAVQSIGKARGMQGAIRYLLQEAKKHMPDLKQQFVFGHSGAPELMEKAIGHIKGPLKVTQWLTCEVGAVIGTYGGKGCVGIAYIAQ